MLSSHGFAIVAIVALVLATGYVESYTRVMPPNFREIEETLPRADINYRLPNDTVPQHYDIVLNTRVDEGVRDFSGTVTIDLTVLVETNSIVLHARQLTFESATIQSSTGQSEALTFNYEPQREFLTLSRTVPFAKDTKWKLTVVYSGLLRSDNGGFYLTTYLDAQGRQSCVVLRVVSC
ncbi:aminopeptidase N-like [Stomoxys calcitrans]|uniref:aminopeptidase N-like n=1 Tax=Stomoxys calcitrans TaxID=35570 RepID=UPI0027E23358|nr:aminopeptidase N-like [Stomoxys calcitrans]